MFMPLADILAFTAPAGSHKAIPVEPQYKTPFCTPDKLSVIFPDPLDVSTENGIALEPKNVFPCGIESGITSSVDHAVPFHFSHIFEAEFNRTMFVGGLVSVTLAGSFNFAESFKRASIKLKKFA
jgi:hypothetical protein